MAERLDDDTASPLLTNGFVFKLTAFIASVALLGVIFIVAARYYGDKLAMDGHTESQERYAITVGRDTLSLPANMIRFENQRRSGAAEVVNIYLSWPEMAGYSAKAASRFSNPKGSQDIVFIEFSQSVMSRDMSGRLGPIYARLFRGEPAQGPANLILHHLDPKSGFGNEVILTGTTKSGDSYVVRCLMPENPDAASSSDCQRDIRIGRDLTLLYRFSSTLLPQWEPLDTAVRTFANNQLQD